MSPSSRYRRLSALPDIKEWLVESLKSREGWHLFFYPFEGRLCTWAPPRCSAIGFAQKHPELGKTFSIAINDYGFELLSPTEMHVDARELRELLDSRHVEVPTSPPGSTRRSLANGSSARSPASPGSSIRAIRGRTNPASSCRHRAACSMTCSPPTTATTCCSSRPFVRCWSNNSKPRPGGRAAATAWQQGAPDGCERPTPFSFPLMVERLREKLSTEQIEQRWRG